MKKMIVQTRNSIAAILLLGSASTAWLGCAKEQLTDPGSAALTDKPDNDQGSAKAPYSVFSFAGGSAPWLFTVTRGLDPQYGQVIRNGGSTFWMAMNTPQTSTTLYVDGVTSPCGGVTNATNCEFAKNSTGSWYYITPNQGPATGKKSLKLRVKTGITLPLQASWFRYSPSTNTWTNDPSAGNYFIFSTVTSFSTIVC